MNDNIKKSLLQDFQQYFLLLWTRTPKPHYYYAMSSLSLFHPVVREWFVTNIGSPSGIQEKAWPQIAAGEHVLITAPTGSGKTLASFLWAINSLLTDMPGSGTRILYVSPLKALNNDIRKNLMGPLAGLKELFRRSNTLFPDISVMVRSGDTPESERRHMRLHPPAILITTPESLAIMLGSLSAKVMFPGVKTVIMDEIHAVAESKRGTLLASSIARLTLLAGEFQRIAASATVNPLPAVADFVGGYTLSRTQSGPVYHKRPVVIVEDKDNVKKYKLEVSSPGMQDRTNLYGDDYWSPFIDMCRAHISRNRSTLLFTNSRKKTEKISRFINEAEKSITAYSHHGSLSREIRLDVEELLKQGKLKAIVATGTLELGIDIGELDEVILVQAPTAIAQAIQRIGRAGHRLGEESRGTLLPLAGLDFLHMPALALAVSRNRPEPIRIPEAPLDILAQTILAITLDEDWSTDRLFDFIRTIQPFRNLLRPHFDMVINMLAGSFKETRIRELEPRIYFDKIENKIRAAKGIRMLLFSSGGAIPDRGYFELREQDTGRLLGELDEEFVWERSIGDTFSFGPGQWRIQSITDRSVLVTVNDKTFAMIPFYKADPQNRSFQFSETVLELLDDAEKHLSDPTGFLELLAAKYFMDKPAAKNLSDYLSLQRQVTKTGLPNRHHIVIEHCSDTTKEDNRKGMILHTFWGGRINTPFAAAISAHWKKTYGYPLEYFVHNDLVLFHMTSDFSAAEFISLCGSLDVQNLLRESLPGSAYFGAQFRENAGRALLLPKGGFGRRMPLWMTRLKSKKLLAAVMSHPDFPILIETWRTCLADHYDLETLQMLLDEIRTGVISVSEAQTISPSPFASELSWYMTNKYMYEDDSLAASSAPCGYIAGINLSPDFLPQIPVELIDEFEAKLGRTFPGWAPDSPQELLSVLEDRVFCTLDEWTKIVQACSRDSGEPANSFTGPLAEKIIQVKSGSATLVACRSREKEIKVLTQKNELIAQYLRFRGPVPEKEMRFLLGISTAQYEEIAEGLASDDLVVQGLLVENSPDRFISDRENYERLLLLKRSRARKSFEPVPAENLFPFTARYQGIISPAEGIDGLKETLEKNFGFQVTGNLWETAILPARVRDYQPVLLDTLLSSSHLVWAGAGKNVFFLLRDEMEYYTNPQSRQKDMTGLFPSTFGKFSFTDLVTQNRKTPGETRNLLLEGIRNSNVSNTSFQFVRTNELAEKKTVEKPDIVKKRHDWKHIKAEEGYWFSLTVFATDEIPAAKSTPVEELELKKERARVLLSRHGILFRELLVHEPAGFRWKDIIPALRIMELSGEIAGGSFVAGIQGLQFADPKALETLKKGNDDMPVYFINACDPASLCGKQLDCFRNKLPARLPGTWCVFHGTRLVASIKRDGAEAQFFCEPDDPGFAEYCGIFRFLLERKCSPLSSIKLTKINNVPSLRSQFKQALEQIGFVADYKALVLRRTI